MISPTPADIIVYSTILVYTLFSLLLLAVGHLSVVSWNCFLTSVNVCMYVYLYIYHFHTSLQREEKVYKWHVALPFTALECNNEKRR